MVVPELPYCLNHVRHAAAAILMFTALFMDPADAGTATVPVIRPVSVPCRQIIHPAVPLFHPAHVVVIQVYIRSVNEYH